MKCIIQTRVLAIEESKNEKDRAEFPYSLYIESFKTIGQVQLPESMKVKSKIKPTLNEEIMVEATIVPYLLDGSRQAKLSIKIFKQVTLKRA